MRLLVGQDHHDQNRDLLSSRPLSFASCCRASHGLTSGPWSGNMSRPWCLGQIYIIIIGTLVHANSASLEFIKQKPRKGALRHSAVHRRSMFSTTDP